MVRKGATYEFDPVAGKVDRGALIPVAEHPLLCLRSAAVRFGGHPRSHPALGGWLACAPRADGPHPPAVLAPGAGSLEYRELRAPRASVLTRPGIALPPSVCVCRGGRVVVERHVVRTLGVLSSVLRLVLIAAVVSGVYSKNSIAQVGRTFCSFPSLADWRARSALGCQMPWALSFLGGQLPWALSFHGLPVRLACSVCLVGARAPPPPALLPPRTYQPAASPASPPPSLRPPAASGAAGRTVAVRAAALPAAPLQLAGAGRR